MRSHATKVVTATPAIMGTPMAITSAMIINTLNTIDHVAAMRAPAVIGIAMCQLSS
jgi:hypothetical protein